MRILHIITTLSSGGAEKMLVDIIRETKRQGIQCEIIVLTKKDNFFGEELTKLNVPVYYGLTNNIYSIKNIYFIREILKKHTYDCIHTHLFASQIFTSMVLKITCQKTLLVTTEHNTHNRRRESRKFYLLDRWMYDQYDKIIAITNGTKDNLVKYLPNTAEKTIVIENGIDIIQYQTAPAIQWNQVIPTFASGEKIILMAAAMREQKDHETVIRASKLLPKHYRIVFVGEGERLEQVKEYAENFGQGNITFLGRRSDLPSLMKSADVFVLSSHWEGFGLVVVEAAATGTPVVASNVTGLNEVVSNIGGILFNPGDEEDLATKIANVLNDELLIMNSDKYSIKQTVDQYIKIYKKLI